MFGNVRLLKNVATHLRTRNLVNISKPRYLGKHKGSNRPFSLTKSAYGPGYALIDKEQMKIEIDDDNVFVFDVR